MGFCKTYTDFLPLAGRVPTFLRFIPVLHQSADLNDIQLRSAFVLNQRQSVTWIFKKKPSVRVEAELDSYMQCLPTPKGAQSWTLTAITIYLDREI
jgi:hypothetical protein